MHYVMKLIRDGKKLLFHWIKDVGVIDWGAFAIFRLSVVKGIDLNLSLWILLFGCSYYYYYYSVRLIVLQVSK